MSSAALLLPLAAVLVLIGRWGRRDAGPLVAKGLPELDCEHRIRVLRRGGLSCYAAAAALVLITVANLVRDFS